MQTDTALLIAAISLTGSFITVVITNLVAVWGKVIDAKQKVNEHKLSIRTAFVNKKIEAGIDFVSKTTVRINNHYLITVFCRYLIENKVFHKEYYEAINNSRSKQREINLNNNLSPHVFFDIVELNDEANKLILEYNSYQIAIADYLKSEGEEEYTESIDKAVRKSLEINEEITKVYRRMNTFVRAELAKYDIL